MVIEEKYVDHWLPSSDIQIDGYDSVTISYHCRNAAVQGYINNIDNTSSNIAGYCNIDQPTLKAVYLAGGTFGVGSRIILTGVRA